jgi:hypothetical protein
MESKIRIKMADIEVEYEGSEAFLKGELPAILDAVSKLHGDKGTTSLTRLQLGARLPHPSRSPAPPVP